MHWKLFTDAGSHEKAERIVSLAIEKLSVSASELKIEPYHKGGFVCSFFAPSNATSWAEVVLEALESAQQIGRGWLLHGNICSELDLWSNESSIVGVKSINLFVGASA